jgi:hypothetical protein
MTAAQARLASGAGLAVTQARVDAASDGLADVDR